MYVLGKTSWYSIDVSGNDRHILLFYKKFHFCNLLPFAKVYRAVLSYWGGLKSSSRLTRKELCHSNETWHALNSTFPDTNCIVSFQINPHLDKLFRALKICTRDISKWSGKLTKGVLLHQDNAPAHKSVVAMAVVHDYGFELVNHPPNFCQA